MGCPLSLNRRDVADGCRMRRPYRGEGVSPHDRDGDTLWGSDGGAQCHERGDALGTPPAGGPRAICRVHVPVREGWAQSDGPHNRGGAATVAGGADDRSLSVAAKHEAYRPEPSLGGVNGACQTAHLCPSNEGQAADGWWHDCARRCEPRHSGALSISRGDKRCRTRRGLESRRVAASRAWDWCRGREIVANHNRELAASEHMRAQRARRAPAGEVSVVAVPAGARSARMCSQLRAFASIVSSSVAGCDHEAHRGVTERVTKPAQPAMTALVPGDQWVFSADLWCSWVSRQRCLSPAFPCRESTRVCWRWYRNTIQRETSALLRTLLGERPRKRQ